MSSQLRSAKRTMPLSANSRPPRIRSKVVLPEPDGPSSAMKQPLGAVRLTPLSAGKRSKRLATDSMTSDIQNLLVTVTGGDFVREPPFENRFQDERDEGEQCEHGCDREGADILVIVVE